MRPSLRLALVLGGVIAASALLAPSAEAQWRPRSRVRVFVGAHIGYPYYYRPFYDPFFYRGFYGWGFGVYPQWSRIRVPRDAVLVRPDVSPNDAQVYVDGYFRGTVTDLDGRFEALVVEPGEHEIVLYLPGYRTARRTVELRGGTVYRLREKLVKLREGEESEPPPPPSPRSEGAPSESRGEQAPPPPPEREALPGRPAPEQPRRIPKPPSELPRERPDLEARGFGSMAIRVQPENAEILIDGERWEFPQTGRPLEVLLAEGPHEIEVRLDGYEAFRTEVQVREGEVVPLNVSLPRR